MDSDERFWQELNREKVKEESGNKLVLKLSADKVNKITNIYGVVNQLKSMTFDCIKLSKLAGKMSIAKENTNNIDKQDIEEMEVRIGNILLKGLSVCQLSNINSIIGCKIHKTLQKDKKEYKNDF